MEKIVNLIHDLIPGYAVPVINSTMALVIGIAIYLLVTRALRKIAVKGYLNLGVRVLLEKIAKWIIVVVVILLSLGFFGVSVGTLWAALSGVLALIALGFVAVWSVLSNLLCSILMIIFPPFRIGDEIEIQEPTAAFSVKGRVIGTNMMYTTLENTAEEEGHEVASMLRIPNNIFFQKYVRVIPGKRTETLQKYVARHQESD